MPGFCGLDAVGHLVGAVVRVVLVDTVDYRANLLALQGVAAVEVQLAVLAGLAVENPRVGVVQGDGVAVGGVSEGGRRAGGRNTQDLRYQVGHSRTADGVGQDDAVVNPALADREVLVVNGPVVAGGFLSGVAGGAEDHL